MLNTQNILFTLSFTNYPKDVEYWAQHITLYYQGLYKQNLGAVMSKVERRALMIVPMEWQRRPSPTINC